MKALLRIAPWLLCMSLTISSWSEQPPADTQFPGSSFMDGLSLKSVGSPAISPDGKDILFTVRRADWEKNRYDTEIWLARDGEVPFQLTQTPDDSSYSPSWSPDGRWVAFLTQRDGSAGQVFLIDPSGGEAFPLTKHETGIGSYAWSPSGGRIAFASAEPPSVESQVQARPFGRFEILDSEFSPTHLWMVDVKPGKTAEAKRLTSGKDFAVGDFNWSPDGKKIAFSHNPNIVQEPDSTSDISILDVESGKIAPLVSKLGPDNTPFWSPDGRWIAFLTRPEDTRLYRNGDIAKIPSGGGPVTVLTTAFDENPSLIGWTRAGIVFSAAERSCFRLYLLSPTNGQVHPVGRRPENILEASFAADGRAVAICGFDRTTLQEIYRADLDSWAPRSVTRMTEQTAGWEVGTREVIEWKSRDGTPIEGILWKPEGFEAGRRYPLLVIIHGGPHSVSFPCLVRDSVYPYLAWLQKGALILEPNYRGSVGYGEKFRKLLARNLGTGEMGDVESGVDDLVARGMVDPGRVGAMGWSHGGFVTAFLSTNSTKFKAFSVGAGASDWLTYYITTDFPMLTRHYLEATPWEDREIYLKASPVTNIRRARTPTLIQHGEYDRIVPIPNAYELYRGFKDLGVPTKFIVYKGLGHAISRPKERLAANWHNWQWFAKYIWGEDVVIPLRLEEGKSD